ncbi:MAG: VWA domain-containing protein [Candidatus Babeliales bacterium]
MVYQTGGASIVMADMRLEHWYVFGGLLLLILCSFVYKLLNGRYAYYRYSMVLLLKNRHIGFVGRYYRRTMYALRVLILVCLAVVTAKLQFIDRRSKISVEGIDIILALDISESMNLQHHGYDKRSRLEVAKVEAIRFIHKRINDQIGLVLFSNEVLSRCPLTLDKNILDTLLNDASTHLLDSDGTLLGKALLAAINRLKQSNADSQVIILLTDGNSTPSDIHISIPIAIARDLGIRIYTIGIGAEEDIVIHHPLYGPVRIGTVFNRKLLEEVSMATGGVFFEAKNQNDMRNIYEKIDSLEKTKIEAPVSIQYRDYFIPIVWLILCLMLVETSLLSLFWFSV